MRAAIKAIEYYLPERTVTTSELAADFPDWSARKIDDKTGISERHIAAEDQCSSDLAVAAAEKLFASANGCKPSDVDYILLCTQSPDYFLPTTACLLQERLHVPTTAGALDYNLGCSGYIYGLGLAQGLIETGQARNVLLITAETYSKFMHLGDKSVRAIFGDAAAATLVSAVDDANSWIGPFVLGTDGSGARDLIVPSGGMRLPRSLETAKTYADAGGNIRSQDHLFMNGADIFNFTLRVVPKTVTDLLCRAGKTSDDIDLFIFHQANKYMLDHLRRRMKIPEDRFYVNMKYCGNTVSSTIPIALRQAQDERKLSHGKLTMLVGFGVGYSWGATLVRWHGDD